jgi:hypothetical protein
MENIMPQQVAQFVIDENNKAKIILNQTVSESLAKKQALSNWLLMFDQLEKMLN